MLGSFNNWNITKLTNNGISSEDFDAINHIALDGISGNMDFLVQIGKYGAMNTIDKKRLLCHYICLGHIYITRRQNH